METKYYHGIHATQQNSGESQQCRQTINLLIVNPKKYENNLQNKTKRIHSRFRISIASPFVFSPKTTKIISSASPFKMFSYSVEQVILAGDAVQRIDSYIKASIVQFDFEKEFLKFKYQYIMEMNENGQSNVATNRFNFTTSYNLMHMLKQTSLNSALNQLNESNSVPDDRNGDDANEKGIFRILKCFVISFIIISAIFGNMLVIVSVMQHRKLR